MMRFNSSTAIVCLGLGAFAITGCGSDLPSWQPSDSKDQVALVTSSLDKPTGTVEASSVKELYAAYQASSVSLDVMLTALAKTNFAGEKCVTKSSKDGTVDLSCASDGKATGTVNFSTDDEITAASTSIFVELDSDKVCVGTICFKATFALQAMGAISGLETTVVASADEGDVHTFVGHQAELSTEQTTSKIALFDSGGRSYTFTAAVDGTFILEGANGAFTCTPASSGGSCVGSTTFMY